LAESSEPDLRAVALRRFSTPATAEPIQKVVNRFASDFETTRASLVAAAAPPDRGSRVCEIGFGTGWLLEELRATLPQAELWGVELLRPLVSHVRDTLKEERLALIAADAEQLPFRDEAFDSVVAAWTLYFIADIGAALRDVRRTLKPGGKAVLATWAKDHMRELGELSTAALQTVFGGAEQREIVERFDVDSAPAMISRHFSRMTVTEISGSLDLPDVDALVRFWELQHASELPDVLIPVRDEFRRLAHQRWDRDGHLRITRHGAIFVGYKE
jgi:SAM-dependent methyltransferase